MKENDRQTVWTAVSLVVQVDAIVVKCAHRRDTIRELRRALAEVTARGTRQGMADRRRIGVQMNSFAPPQNAGMVR